MLEETSTFMITIIAFQFIASPIQKTSIYNDGRRAMILLKERILKTIVLRRTKEGRAADLALPPRIVSVIATFLPIYQEIIDPIFLMSLMEKYSWWSHSGAFGIICIWMSYMHISYWWGYLYAMNVHGWMKGLIYVTCMYLNAHFIVGLFEAGFSG